MSQELIMTERKNKKINQEHLRFYTETIEVGRVSPLSFYEAGSSLYKDEHFYWQNAKQTLTLVGIGHARVLKSEAVESRFDDISAMWRNLCDGLIKEDKDLSPILFGGFSFDPANKIDSEWRDFPAAYFVVPSFQLVIKEGETMISINLITSSEDAHTEFEKLRKELDHLLHLAQVSEFEPFVKPTVLSVEERNKEAYMNAVTDVTSRIKAGEAEKVVIARAIKMNFEQAVSNVSALHHISSEQHESYHFGLQKSNHLFFGASPERLIEVKNGQAYSACVAGSIERGKSAIEDRKLSNELLDDQKNRDEHQYVVNMIFNVFTKHCMNVTMPKKPQLMKIRDIQHLFTPIEGEMEKDVDIFKLVKALHPTPALGGAPTDKSMEIIREVEEMDRGYYAAPVGWADSEGNGEFIVAIRSALLHEKSAYLFAGGGIVADSEATTEYEETWVKFRPILRALGGKLNG